MRRSLTFIVIALFLFVSCEKEPLSTTDRNGLEYTQMSEDAILAKSKEVKNDQNKIKTKTLKLFGAINRTSSEATGRFRSSILDKGTGNSTVLGVYELNVDYIFVDLRPTSVRFRQSNGKLTVGNGDQLLFILTDDNPNNVNNTSIRRYSISNNRYTITGGSGKYAGASGSISLLFTNETGDKFSDGNYTYTGTGTLTY